MSRQALLLTAALVAAMPNLAPAGGLLPGKPETATATVSLAGLDLSTTAGLARAEERLTNMAERLCRKFRDDRRAADWATYVDCVHETLAGVLEKIQPPSARVARK